MYYLKNSVSPYYASIIFSNNLPMLALVSIPLPFLTSWSPLSQPHFHLSTLSSLVFRSLLSSTSTPQSIIIIPPLWISSIICPFHHHYLSKLQSQLKIIICLLCAWAQSDKCCWRKKKSYNQADWLHYIFMITNLNCAFNNANPMKAALASLPTCQNDYFLPSTQTYFILSPHPTLSYFPI